MLQTHCMAQQGAARQSKAYTRYKPHIRLKHVAKPLQCTARHSKAYTAGMGMLQAHCKAQYGIARHSKAQQGIARHTHVTNPMAWHTYNKA